MTQFTKDDIARVLQTPAQVSKAIEILGDNQREDELSSRSTNTQNGIGFTSCWASAGTHLWQFVTGFDARTKTNRWGRKCLSHPNWQKAKAIRRKVQNNGCEDAVQLGRKIALHHWRQLGMLLGTKATPSTPHQDLIMLPVPSSKLAEAIEILKKHGII